MHALLKAIKPGANAIAGSIEMRHARPGSMDDHPAQIFVATLANPQQRRLTSRGVLPGNQTQPRSHIAGFSELPS
jgi:hypothetical protein